MARTGANSRGWSFLVLRRRQSLHLLMWFNVFTTARRQSQHLSGFHPDGTRQEFSRRISQTLPERAGSVLPWRPLTFIPGTRLRFPVVNLRCRAVRLDLHTAFQHNRRCDGNSVDPYPGITSSFSAGIFATRSGPRLRCDVAVSGGRRLSQLFKETSINSSALNISKKTASVSPVFSM
jgi:hypothetical protein